MENHSRNLAVNVWENWDNPIKSYDFSKFGLISCMPPSQVALCYNSVMSQQYNYFGTVNKFQNCLLFMKSIMFILRYVRAKIIVHCIYV